MLALNHRAARPVRGARAPLLTGVTSAHRRCVRTRYRGTAVEEQEEPAAPPPAEQEQREPSPTRWAQEPLAWRLRAETTQEVAKMLDRWGDGFKRYWATWKPPRQAPGQGPLPPLHDGRPAYLEEVDGDGYLVDQLVCYGELVEVVYDTLETRDVESQFFGKCAPGTIQPDGGPAPAAPGARGEGPAGGRRRTLGDVAARGTRWPLHEEDAAAAQGGGAAEGGPAASSPSAWLPCITVGELAGQYKVRQLIYADSGPYKLVAREGRNYVGFVATRELPESEGGGVDIAVAFRGTVTQDEWVQDAKAVKVPWNGGRHVRAPPSAGLSRSLFGAVGAPAQAAAGLAAAATYSSQVRRMLEAAGPLGGGDPLQEVLAFAAAAGVAVAVTALGALLSGFLESPRAWLANVTLLFTKALPDWAAWGLGGFVDSARSVVRPGEAWVSYGFKEMYVDAKEDGDSDPDVKHESPRLTVYRALAQVMEELLEEARQKGGASGRVSVSTTGHSLGAALASLCAFDVGAAVDEATGDGAPQCAHSDETGWLRALHDESDKHRGRFMDAVNQWRDLGGEAPAVAAIAFAPPRVGDLNYAKGFRGRSLQNPTSICDPEPRDSDPVAWAGYWLSYLGLAFLRPWYWVGHRQIAASGGLGHGSANLIRVVNVHDVVPKLPAALNVPAVSFVHGGQELLLNSRHVPYFAADPLWGSSLVALHSMSLYNHLLDPTRDPALVNKNDRILVRKIEGRGDGEGDFSFFVPAGWWQPVPFKRMEPSGPRGWWARPHKQ